VRLERAEWRRQLRADILGNRCSSDLLIEARAGRRERSTGPLEYSVSIRSLTSTAAGAKRSNKALWVRLASRATRPLSLKGSRNNAGACGLALSTCQSI